MGETGLWINDADLCDFDLPEAQQEPADRLGIESLKEKRMVVKSLLAKIRNKFQVSAAEVEDALT